MSEMLGNQYFMARRYQSALEEFESVLLSDPSNKQVRKKLIICYLQVGKINQSFDLFVDLISEDINCIVDTDPEIDDCPCPEIVNNLEEIFGNSNLSKSDRFKVLGILWLFCDHNKSAAYFLKYLELNNDDVLAAQIYSNISDLNITSKAKN